MTVRTDMTGHDTAVSSPVVRTLMFGVVKLIGKPRAGPPPAPTKSYRNRLIEQRQYTRIT